MARLNAIKPTVEYAADVGRDMADRDFTMNWKTWLPWSIYVLDHIEKYAEKHLLGEQIMRFCQNNQAKIKTLKRIALELMHVVTYLPVGLIHGDFLPGNTGWRNKPRELVVFDFEDILFDTRFYDIAFVLGGWDIEGKHSATQRDLAEIYLKAYSQYGGNTVRIENFLKEITVVWYARKLNLWEYFPPDLLNAPSYESGMPGNTRQARLDLLYKNMNILVSRAAQIEALLA
jgi:Ser/Thr protein kinase RdoA (MazF antagonist)